MTDLATLQSIRDRVAKATGPDRDIDGAIAVTVEGYVLVPREPTEEMAKPLTRLWLLSDQDANSDDMLEAKGYLKAALAASPYAKKEVE